MADGRRVKRIGVLTLLGGERERELVRVEVQVRERREVVKGWPRREDWGEVEADDDEVVVESVVLTLLA